MPDGTGKVVETYKIEGQTLALAECLTFMASMRCESVDVVVTSPPYNLSLSYSLYDDSLDETEYVDWFEGVALGIKRLMKPEGSFFLNFAGSNSRPYLPFEVITRLRQSGFFLQNHVTWIKSIGMENSSRGHFKPVGGRRFMHHNHEHIFHLTLTNKVKLDRLSIGIPFQDKTNIARRQHTRDLRCRGNTWFLPYSTVKSRKQKFNHPGTFPVELPLWCIYLHGGKRLQVLDPFVGTGTTLVAARMAGACGIGIDLDPAYIATARLRIEELAMGALDIELDQPEIHELLQQGPATEKDGGWQGMLVGFQKRLNKTTGHLMLTSCDLGQIRKYSQYNKEGFQDRLRKMFERTLGANLDGKP